MNRILPWLAIAVAAAIFIGELPFVSSSGWLTIAGFALVAVGGGRVLRSAGAPREKLWGGLAVLAGLSGFFILRFAFDAGFSEALSLFSFLPFCALCGATSLFFAKASSWPRILATTGVAAAFVAGLTESLFWMDVAPIGSATFDMLLGVDMLPLVAALAVAAAAVLTMHGESITKPAPVASPEALTIENEK